MASWKRRAASAAVLLLAVACWRRPGVAAGEVMIPDDPVLDYRIVDLEPRSESGVKLNPELEQVTETSTRLYRSVRDGKPVYIFEREERTAKNDRIFWTFVLDTQQLGLMRIEKKTLSRSGQVVRESWVNYRDPLFSFPEKLCHIYTISVMVRVMDLKAGARDDFYLLLSEDASPWHMFVVVDGEEKVTVPAGTFDCWRLKLEPDYDDILGRWSWASTMIKPLVPDFFFWVAKDGTHPLIRFEGKFGPVGAAPSQAHELTGIHPPQ
ncbi:MAG TPA: DUF3108 domain-containing protein [bacterium]|nr:DUF3108 domain-containing protein [bacterium]